MKLLWSNFVINFAKAFLVMSLQAMVSAQTNDYPPTVFTQQPQGGLPELRGNRKVLTCSANGIPSPVYRWIKDGALVSQNSTDMSLQIRNISLLDAGVYQCIASNELGSLLSSRAAVSVAYMVPYNSSRDTVVITAREGHAGIISLPPLGSIPAPSIQWKEPGTGYTITGETQRYHVTQSNQLVILETRVAFENNKTFKATVINSFVQQSMDSPTYLLSVQDSGNQNGDILPEFVLPPNSTTAVQGDDFVKLECIANARPLNLLSLNWYRKVNGNKQLIQQDNKYLLSLYRRTLTIREPSTADSGVYQCEASFTKPGEINASRPIVAEANLTVYVRPSFVTIPPSELDVDMGMSQMLQCQALGVPPPTVKWYRNSVLIDDATNDRYQLASNGSLKLLNVTTSDSGVFQCFVTNSAGELSTSIWLWVGTSGPEIITAPQNVSVITGDSSRFMCEAKGAPKPVIHWSRVMSGVLTELTMSTAHIQVLGGELLIPVTDISDEGLYICNATNTIGNDLAQAFLTVTIRTRIDRPPQSLSVIKTLNALFQCGVTRDPSVTVVWHWFLDGMEISSTDSRWSIQADGSLEVRNVRNTDIGNYTCVVVSIGGNATASASLKVIELPYAPEITSVQLSPGSNRSIDITWNPGFDGLSPVKSFILRYRVVTPSGTDVWKIATSSIAPDQRSYTLADLKPAKSYQFTISAVNDVGESPQSSPSDTISLPQQPPSGPPRSFTGSPRSNSSILLQWQAPDPELMNGDLLGYIVRYKPSGYPDSTISTINLTTYQENVVYELTGLIVFQEYEVAIAAFNSKGVGVYCGSLFIRTFEGTPSMPPTALVVVAVNSTTFNISWFPPNPQYINGINQGYKIFAQEVNTTVKMTWVVLSKTNNMLGQQTTYLTNLRKFTLYSVSVLCFTSQGDGPLSASVSQQTLEDIPDRVSNLSFTNIMDTSLSVVWSPPLTANGILTGYTLTYMKKDLLETKVTMELSASVLNFTITGLAPTTTYTISIWAKTRVGAGQSRSADIRSGVTPVLPSAPTSLAVTNIRDRSVLLQFVPGFSGYTSISRWIVEGQTNENILQNSWITIYTTSDPDANSLTVLGLRPFTRYRLRIIAENIAGQSNASDATQWFDTLQALPSAPPSDVTVRAINETSIRIRWMVLPRTSWNGDSRGYIVQWKLHSSFNFSNSVTIADENANSYQLNGLRKYTKYDVQVAAFNSIGVGSYSLTATDQTLESTPSSGPADVAAVTLNSTVIQVSWGNISEDDRNGLILGYKVIYHLSSDPSHLLVKSVSDSFLREVNVTGLSKFSWYSFRVLAYTGIGDGVPSQPPAQAMTFEDVPGPPSSVYFPEVTETTARIVWTPPREPNGNLTGYKVAYGIRSEPQDFTFEINQLGVDDRSYLATSLVRQSYYVFNVTARTTLGWGEPAQVVVFTIAERKAPEAPNKPFVSQVGDRWAIINWTPRGDGYGPIRNFSIEYQMNNGSFMRIDVYIDANRRDFRATDLKPNSFYRFRVIAFNDIGPSNYSESSDQVQTDASAPEGAPTITSIVTETATSMQVSWQPPPEATWNGALLGFDVAYREGNSDEPWQILTVNNPRQYSALIGNVQLFVVYEVKVRAFNRKGRSDYSPVSTIYLEIAPTGPVLNLRLLNTTSTSALVAWDPPLMSQWNGNILGYKIFCWMTQSQENSSSVLIVQGSDNSADISSLVPYTNYAMTVLAFNMAGDGPNVTIPLNVTTNQDVPGPPGSLLFVVPSPNSLNMSWDPPILPNGIIEMYEVSFHQYFELDGVTKSVQVLLSPDKTYYFTQPLIEAMTYNFSIRARTSAGWGQPSTARVTIGPQPGSPEAPSKPTYTVDDKSVKLTWAYGKPGNFPETGCLTQVQEKSSSVWETKVTSATPVVTATISFLTIKPKVDYRFRVIAVNARGIGPPSEATEYVRSVDVLAEVDKPFYQQWWFLVIVALIGVIIIILVTSCLCITGRRYRSQRQKTEKPTNSLPRTTLQLNQIQHSEANTDNDFSVFEVHRTTRSSQRTLTGVPSTSDSRTNQSSRSARRHPQPPRPSPGRVNYNFDDERKSSPDSSSLSEKASDVSTTRSDSDDDVDKGSPTPQAFPSHYVSGTVKNSLGRRNTYNPYSMTDSEQDGSQYAMSLNGGHVMINNVAGSRAPLPGFSSFV